MVQILENARCSCAGDGSAADGRGRGVHGSCRDPGHATSVL